MIGIYYELIRVQLPPTEFRILHREMVPPPRTALLMTCGECAAVVQADDRPKHDSWHHQLDANGRH